MDKRWIAIITLALLMPAIVIGTSLLKDDTEFSPTTNESLEECKTILNNGEGTNIVFFGSKKLSEEYTDFFLNTKPFNKNKDSFNFFYIDNYKPECDLYKGIAILCHSKELVKKAASCPNDYIVVLESRESKIRSSSYLNVLSINSNHPKSVLTHEFGHAFINLAEEYTPAKIPLGSQNCVTSCERFPDEVNGCFEGCSQSNYIRSIDNGVMRTLNSNEYGIFNEQLITSQITKTSRITGKAIGDENNCNNQNYYLIEGNYEQGSVNIHDKTLETGCIGGNGFGPFNYDIIQKDGNIISGNEFNPEYFFTSAPGEDQIDGEIFDYEGNFLLKIPIIANSETLSISRNTLILEQTRIDDINSRVCII